MKKKHFRLHVWEIKGTELSVVMDKIFMRKMRERAIEIRYAKVAKKVGISKRGLRQIFFKASGRLHNFLKIAKALKIDPRVLEKKINQIGSRKRKYNITFPLELTPLHLRPVAHLIGDGSYSSSQWNQLKDYESHMLGLLSQIGCNTIKPCHYSRSSSGSMRFYTNIHIPRFLVIAWEMKMGSKVITPAFIKSLSKLPREYGIELILALLIDEGHIPQKATNIWFGMRNREICEAVYKLCVSLGYKSRLNEYMIEDKPFYRISFLADGISLLEKDVRHLEDKYGIFAGLWHKSTDFKRRCSRLRPEWKKWREDAEKLREEVIEIVKQKGAIKIREIASLLQIPSNKIWNALRSAKKLIRKKNGLLIYPSYPAKKDAKNK